MLGGRGERGTRLELVMRVMRSLDSDGDGRIDRSELHAFTRTRSATFGKYVRALFNTLDADADGQISSEELMNDATDVELAVLANPLVLEAFDALDAHKAGRLDAQAVARILVAKRLESATRADARPLLEGLLASRSAAAAGAQPSIGLEQLLALSGEELELLERTGREAARTGYIPPELMDTPIDDAWERRVISEARSGAGGMSCAQADILRSAIKWGR